MACAGTQLGVGNMEENFDAVVIAPSLSILGKRNIEGGNFQCSFNLLYIILYIINVNHYLKIPIFKHIDSVRKNSRIEQSFANLSLRKITISIQGFSSDHPPQETATVRHFSRSPSRRNYAPFPLISALLSRTFTNRAFPSVYNAPLRGPYKSMHTRGCSFLFANGVVPPQCPPYSISWTRPSTSPLLSLPKPPLPSLLRESPRQNSSLNEREEN